MRKGVLCFTVALLSFALCQAQAEKAVPSKPGSNSMPRLLAGRSCPDSTSKPLFVVDRRIVPEETFKKLDANKVESLTVLKDSSAVALYGPCAAHGVVVAVLKEGTARQDAARIDPPRDAPSGKTTATLESGAPKPLYVIDGRIVPEETVRRITPDRIKSLTVLKDSSAVALFGPPAAKGVVVVVLKKE